MLPVEFCRLSVSSASYHHTGVFVCVCLGQLLMGQSPALQYCLSLTTLRANVFYWFICFIHFYGITNKISHANNIIVAVCHMFRSCTSCNHPKAMEPQDIHVGQTIGSLLTSAPSPSQVHYLLSRYSLHNMFLSDN